MCGLKLEIFVGYYLVVTNKCRSFAAVPTRKFSQTNDFTARGSFIVGHIY